MDGQTSPRTNQTKTNLIGPSGNQAWQWKSPALIDRLFSHESLLIMIEVNHSEAPSITMNVSHYDVPINVMVYIWLVVWNIWIMFPFRWEYSSQLLLTPSSEG